MNFQNNPKLFGIALILIGIILFILVLFNKIDIGNNKNGIKNFLSLFNKNIAAIISKIFFYLIAIVFILVGVALLLI
jgi:hypothetical protein